MKCDNKNWNIYLCVQCREIGYETHEEILRVLHELHTTMKTYHSYQGEYRQAENKLRITEAQRQKMEQSLPPEKLDRSKKYRVLEKEVQKVSVQIEVILESILRWIFESRKGEAGEHYISRDFAIFITYFAITGCTVWHVVFQNQFLPHSHFMGCAVWLVQFQIIQFEAYTVLKI